MLQLKDPLSTKTPILFLAFVLWLSLDTMAMLSNVDTGESLAAPVASKSVAGNSHPSP